MKSQRAIKEHKSIMHGFTISPTELLQHQVKCFVLLNELTVGTDLGGGGRKVSMKSKLSRTTHGERGLAFIIF